VHLGATLCLDHPRPDTHSPSNGLVQFTDHIYIYGSVSEEGFLGNTGVCVLWGHHITIIRKEDISHFWGGGGGRKAYQPKRRLILSPLTWKIW